ncbi:MAG TPA: hypothetical protein VM284_03255, partial [Candidatus Limnocylindria bacterium]|nr:hypothetical protein [Candidatus Limnocylindria bacterium]
TSRTETTRRREMYQSTHSLQLDSDYLQHELLRDAEARRLARGTQSSDDEPRFSLHRVQRQFVAVAVALVTVLGAMALL